GDHHGRGVDICPDRSRHNGGVYHAETFQPVHSARLVHDSHGVRLRTHLASPGRVDTCDTDIPHHPGIQCVVRIEVGRLEGDLFYDDVAQFGFFAQPENLPHAVPQPFPVATFRQIPIIQFGLHMRV